MTKFSPISRQCCLDTMDALMAHPIAIAFFDAMESGDLPKDFDPKKQSSGLKQVQEKLAANKYATISQWEKDVRQVFSLIEKMNPENEFYNILGREMEKIFKKEEEHHMRAKTPKWAAAIVKLDKKIDAILNIPPPVVIANTPIDPQLISIEKPFSEDEMNSFVKYSKFLNSEEDNRAILSIIRRHQPDLPIPGKNAVVDVSDLSVESMLSLRKFFTERLASMNIQYPHSVS